MTPAACAVLVMARAPVKGQAKTRLAPRFGADGAAELAAASLLDTLAAVRAADVTVRIAAITGDLASAHRSVEIRSMLADFKVIRQRGSQFAERLVNAHEEAAALADCPVLQIGMDTPQVSADLLGMAATVLTRQHGAAVLGLATDGGWWILGLSDPLQASVLRGISMSQSDTGARTLAALKERGIHVSEISVLADVDTEDDVWRVADGLGTDTNFRRAADRYRRPVEPRRLGEVPTAS